MQQPDAAPRAADGFRERGHQVTRLETFVDAAFAFAVTLLVVSFDRLPEDFAQLSAALKQAPAFLAAFAVLAAFWLSHHRFSRRLGLEDGWIVFLSLALVAVTLLYVYPLRMIMGVAMHHLTMGWAPSAMDARDPAELRAFYIIYAVGFLAMCAIVSAMNLHALRRRAALGLDAVEAFLLRMELWIHALLALPALASIVLALLIPATGASALAMGAPGIVYCVLGIVVPVVAYRAEKRRLAIVAGGEGTGHAARGNTGT